MINTIVPILGIGILLASMLGGKLYPKQTIVIIVTAVIVVLVIPVMIYVNTNNIGVCP